MANEKLRTTAANKNARISASFAGSLIIVLIQKMPKIVAGPMDTTTTVAFGPGLGKTSRKTR